LPQKEVFKKLDGLWRISKMANMVSGRIAVKTFPLNDLRPDPSHLSASVAKPNESLWRN
jgi:hypothetical protein